jgi:hypothetical protein
MDPDQIRIERQKLEQDAGQALQKLMDEFEAKTAWKIDGISVSIADSGTQLDMRGEARLSVCSLSACIWKSCNCQTDALPIHAARARPADNHADALGARHVPAFALPFPLS